MRISIIICTRNRADALRETLTSIAAVCLPAEFITELLVIDNGSEDHTPEVVADAIIPQMDVRYLKEPRKGQCFARNTGVRYSRGEVLLFTDDDVRVPPDWVIEMCAPILTHSADGVAGGVRLAAHLERPWMTPVHGAMMATTDYIAQRDSSDMIGANMAVARSVFLKVASFDTELDPGALGLGGDTLFKMQFDQAGFQAVARRTVCVEHHPDPSRLLRSSFLSAGEKVGRFHGYRDYHWHHTDPKLPQLRLLRWRLQLALWRAVHPAACRHVEGIDAVELHYVFYVHRFEQYLQERKRPRNYPPCGLSKCNMSADLLHAPESTA